MKQFLVESTCLTLIGGAIGIFSGIVIAYLIAVGAKFAGFKWDFVVTASSILLGLSVSVIIGIIFGAYPARQAAKKEPVEALRAE